MMDRIYFDHAGTTPVTEHVLNGMIPYFREIYGNASSIHATGRTARKAVENAEDEELGTFDAPITDFETEEEE